MRFTFLLLTFSLVLSNLAPATEALFIGNSYTFGAFKDRGGIPKVVELIATSKGKQFTAQMLTASGKGWGFHLGRPDTYHTLHAKPWNWVVLQDVSTSPTRIGNVKQFFTNGETLYREIRKASPNSAVLLYATWAPRKDHAIYGTSDGFAGPEQMTRELLENYSELQRQLEMIEPGTQVSLAPVGTAFQLCQQEYPNINLFEKDKRHPSFSGCYLAALVLYATMYQENPAGATHDLPGGSIDDAVAEKLQTIAWKAVQPN